MATTKVLEEAVKKLKYNNNILLQQILTSTSSKQTERLQQQIAHNESMILDYQYRIKNNLG